VLQQGKCFTYLEIEHYLYCTVQASVTVSLGHNEICSEPLFLNEHGVHKCVIYFAVKMVD